MAKKAVLVITDPGMPPTVFLVDEETITDPGVDILEAACDHLGLERFDIEDVHEATDLRHVADILAVDFEQTLRKVQKGQQFLKQYGGTTTGRMSMKDTRLNAIERQAAKAVDFSFSTARYLNPTGRLPPGPECVPLNPSLQGKKYEKPAILFEFDYAEIEKRIFAALGTPIMQIYDEYVFEIEEKNLPAAREAMRKVCEDVFKKVRFPVMKAGDFYLYDGGDGRWKSSESNLQELPKKLKTPNGKEIGRTWDPCCEGCLGWVHMNDPYEIEECDECGRFTVDTVTGSSCGTPQDAAVKAHREECGCGWPEFDVQDAAMAWAKDMGPEMDDDVKELRELLNERGIEFMDNITPAIYVCSRILESSGKGSPNHTAGVGLMKLLQETQEKIGNEELKLKDFGEPPGEDEAEASCDDCGTALVDRRCPKCDGSFTHP